MSFAKTEKALVPPSHPFRDKFSGLIEWKSHESVMNNSYVFKMKDGGGKRKSGTGVSLVVQPALG